MRPLPNPGAHPRNQILPSGAPEAAEAQFTTNAQLNRTRSAVQPARESHLRLRIERANGLATRLGHIAKEVNNIGDALHGLFVLFMVVGVMACVRLWLIDGRRVGIPNRPKLLSPRA